VQFELTDAEMLALLNLLVESIEADKFPRSPRIRILRATVAKLGPMAPAPPFALPPTGRVRPETRVFLSAAASEVR
jgi:hypothetical protein